MNKTEFEIDPNIWRQNIKFLEELKYIPIEDIDEHESITPTTNKGHLTQESKVFFFKSVFEKLQELKESNREKDFYTQVQGNFENQDHLGRFIDNQEQTLKHFDSDKIFIKKYQYKDSDTSKVLRFGINLQYKDLKIELEEHNNKQKTLSEHTKDTKNFVKVVESTALAPQEIVALECAINILLNTDSKTVLIDIFKRDIERKITDVQDTHTVALYKAENKILVIDPSNPTFSSHLVNYDRNLLEVDYSEKTKIYAPVSEKSDVGQKLIEFYKSITGICHDQYRDCIDIAVKIAFGLNASSEKCNSIKNIKTLKVIQSVSNNDEINTSILKDIQKEHFVKAPLKIMQKSNISISDKFFEYSQKIKEKLLFINKYPDKEQEAHKIAENYKKILEEPSESKAFKYVNSIYQYSTDQKIQILTNECEREKIELSLIGEELKNVDLGDLS